LRALHLNLFTVPSDFQLFTASLILPNNPFLLKHTLSGTRKGFLETLLKFIGF